MKTLLSANIVACLFSFATMSLTRCII